MDEEEELDNTLIGQEEEAPGVNTGDVVMGGLGPVLIGTGTSTSGVTTPRLVPGTSIVPTGQPPAVTSTGGPPATTSGSAVKSARDFAYTLNRSNRLLRNLRRG